MKHSLSDKELIAGIIKGQADCYTLLIDRYSNYAFTLAHRVLENREDAEEVAHDAFLKAFKSLEGFKMESKFTTWFYRIVVNLAISRKRKKKIQTQDITDMGANVSHYSTFSEMAHLPGQDRKHFLDKALKELNDEDRTLITLYYYKDLEMEDIAKITQLERSNLKVKIFRARKKLAGTLTRLLHNEVESIL